MRILVTGGAGYIGSHAAKALHRAGYRVVVFDNLSAGHRDAVKYGDFVAGDIGDTAAVRATLRRYRISAVMHFAALLDVGESVREPARYYRNNVTGALSVLEAMVAEQAGRFVFSSTCATYGEPMAGVQERINAIWALAAEYGRKPRISASCATSTASAPQRPALRTTSRQFFSEQIRQEPSPPLKDWPLIYAPKASGTEC
jgi:UDP-glucose 4-epimerase